MLGAMVDFEDMTVLELFAGTGAFSLECLSRGIKFADAVDHQALHVKCIADNFRLFEISNARVHREDVFRWIEKCDQSFNLVFADPPHDMPGILECPDKIMNSAVMSPESLLILEHNHREDFSRHKCYLKSRRFSNVTFSFFKK